MLLIVFLRADELFRTADSLFAACASQAVFQSPSTHGVIPNPVACFRRTGVRDPLLPFLLWLTSCRVLETVAT